MENQEKYVTFNKHYKYEGVLKGQMVGKKVDEKHLAFVSIVCRRATPFTPWVFTQDNKEYRISASSVEEMIVKLRKELQIGPEVVIRMLFSFNKMTELGTMLSPDELTVSQRLRDCNVELYSNNMMG